MSTRNLKRWMKRQKQKGFTLLELLVVVAILAAVAGTATIALQDTDSRAAAAAHVAMMDELNKGIRTYRVLNRTEGEVFPDHWDSLIETDTAVTTTAITGGSIQNATTGVDQYIAIEDVVTYNLTADLLGKLNDVTITSLQYIDTNNDASVDDTISDCTLVQAVINSRSNASVAGNIFMAPKTLTLDGAEGCGIAHTLVVGDPIATWTGGQGRLLGQPAASVTYNDEDNRAFMVVGAGPASTLFEGGKLGALSSVPVYRHVAKDQYNRFMVIFGIGTYDGSGVIVPTDQVTLVAILDGAGDTKEEELGEWDGTRNTI